MMRWLGPLAAMIITALAAHGATLYLTPSVIMDRALATLAKRNIALHAFTSPVRVTPQTQAVVRSSPDLFYSLCRYDLSEGTGPLDIRMSEWPLYQSLSFFDGETNNFATLRGEGEARGARLFAPGASPEKRKDETLDTQWIESPTERGVILIRRLAPTQGLFDEAKTASTGDACALVES